VVLGQLQQNPVPTEELVREPKRAQAPAQHLVVLLARDVA
jgi:hypothetical protein